MGMRCEKAEFWWEIASDRRLMTHDCILRALLAIHPLITARIPPKLLLAHFSKIGLDPSSSG